jgi:large subunit ribosomal protein L30
MPRTFVWHPGRGPKKTEPNTLTNGSVRIKQVRSGIGHPARMRATLRAIGLRHHQDEVVHPDSPSLRGMIKQVRHLVVVTPVEVAKKAGKRASSRKAAGTAAGTTASASESAGTATSTTSTSEEK